MAHRRTAVRIRDEDVYTAGSLFGPWEARKWTPRRGNFSSPKQAKLAELVRGELIERLDERLCAAVPFFESKYGMSRAAIYDLMSTIAAVLFPEDFCDDDTAAEEIARAIAHRNALVPRDGPIERVGWEAMEAYAESLGIDLNAIEEPSVPEPVVIGGIRFPESERVVLARRGR